MRHAQLWRHVDGQSHDILKDHVAFMDYALPIMGRLAGDPSVKPKDVIKALSEAVADGKMEPAKAVANLADMPADQDKLQPWLKAKYADALTTTVHAKAALMRRGMMGAPEEGTPPGPAPGGVAPQPAMPQGAMPSAATGAPPGVTVQ
jgi:hypothetical protein